ncbi:MAG: hypothetical protein WKF77_29790 [Planctomycetaceae bacterium]
MATGEFGKLIKQAQQGDADAMDRLLKEYGDAIQREIWFCLLDQRLRQVVGESDVFQSVIFQFALKLREGRYRFDSPRDLIGLLKVMARTHVAQLARFGRCSGVICARTHIWMLKASRIHPPTIRQPAT